MFERFTNRARRVVVLAQEQARQLGHNYIGTEHILLGLAKENHGIAARMLLAHGMTYDVVRADVIAKVGSSPGAEVSGHIPFTPRAKKSLELSLREALALHHNYIGTEHLLLGLMREDEGVAAQVLRSHVDLLTLRTEVLDIVPAFEPSEEKDTLKAATAALVTRMRQRLAGRSRDDDEPGGEPPLQATPAVEAAIRQAVELAGTDAVGSHHLILAALTDDNSAAAHALVSLGVDLDTVREKLRGADVTGTSDEEPDEAGRRQMSVQVTDETLTLVATDPVIVAAGKAALAAVNAGTGSTGEGEASATATVIRGDHPAATGFADVWTELHQALEKITNSAAPPAAA